MTAKWRYPLPYLLKETSLQNQSESHSNRQIHRIRGPNTYLPSCCWSYLYSTAQSTGTIIPSPPSRICLVQSISGVDRPRLSSLSIMNCMIERIQRGKWLWNSKKLYSFRDQCLARQQKFKKKRPNHLVKSSGSVRYSYHALDLVSCSDLLRKVWEM